MSGTGRGFAVALAMLVGALSLTSLLALVLQGRAVQQQPAAAYYSPSTDAIVEPSGWPHEEKAPPKLPEVLREERDGAACRPRRRNRALG